MMLPVPTSPTWLNMSYTVSRELVCHPQTPAGHISAINVEVANTDDDKLTLIYVVQGDLDSLCIPEDRPCTWVDELWRHSCFEAFVMPADGPGYLEYNFSPSSEWTAYTFRGYRQAHNQQTPQYEDAPPPLIRVHRKTKSLTLKAEISLQLPVPDRSLRLGLSAVMETADGSLCYWALRHPPGKPDFHHVDAFDLQINLS